MLFRKGDAHEGRHSKRLNKKMQQNERSYSYALPRLSQDAPKTLPRRSQNVPKTFQDAPRSSQYARKTLQDASKTSFFYVLLSIKL